jgi:hypothetical protein
MNLTPEQLRHVRGLQNRCDELLAQGRFAETLPVLDELIRLTGDPRAYAKLGISLLRLSDYAGAELNLKRALDLLGDDIDVYDGLTELYGILDNSAYREYGRKSLQLKDRLCRGAPSELRQPTHTHEREGGKRLISFSLFGADPKYCETAVLNVEAAAALYPDFVCRFHVDGSVPRGVLERLARAGADVIEVPARHRRLPGSMWRFLAVDDPDAAVILFRDADSVVGPRERILVDRWLAGGRPFHIIRDWYTHSELILAGLFGLRGGFISGMAELMHAYVTARAKLSRWSDQYFLRETIWPRVREVALTHDRCFGFGVHVEPFPAPPPKQAWEHVGANMASSEAEVGAPYPDGTRVIWTAHDARSDLFAYEAVVTGGKIRFHIPRAYGDKFRQGLWSIRLSPAA